MKNKILFEKKIDMFQFATKFEKKKKKKKRTHKDCSYRKKLEVLL